MRAVSALAAGAACIVAFRRWQLRWGARSAEVEADLVGDDLLPTADLVATRAVTIDASAAHVWAWIAQIGQGRAGFYSYDFLENLAGCDIHSADRIVPEWQDLQVGDEVRLHPDIALRVAMFEEGSALVLHGGVPIAEAPPPFDFTWAFVLAEQPDGTTRLQVRERYAWERRWVRLLIEPVAAISFVMTQRMLRGIRDRAEADSGRRAR
jgi:hypothetical protein